MQVVVKNTFLEVVVTPSDAAETPGPKSPGAMLRSKSENVQRISFGREDSAFSIKDSDSDKSPLSHTESNGSGGANFGSLLTPTGSTHIGYHGFRAVTNEDAHKVVVKNTFLEVVCTPSDAPELPHIRSKSEKVPKRSFSPHSDKSTSAHSPCEFGMDSESDQLSPKSTGQTSTAFGESNNSFGDSSTNFGALIPVSGSVCASTTGFLQPDAGSLEEDSYDGPPLSIKEDLHRAGNCKPCFLAASRSGCRSGDSCKFCHEEHDEYRVRCRPSKGARSLCKQVVGMLEAGDPRAAELVKDLLETHGSYMTSVLRASSGRWKEASHEIAALMDSDAALRKAMMPQGAARKLRSRRGSAQGIINTQHQQQVEEVAANRRSSY